jgi:hypothetical protein
MNQLTAIAAATAALGLLAAPATAEERPKGEAKLAKLLENRVAGEPERCIRLMGNDPLTIIDGTALVAKQGNTVWVNRTANPESLDDNDRMVIRKFSASQLCRLDQVTTYARHGDYYTGNIMLQDFVPYRLEG